MKAASWVILCMIAGVIAVIASPFPKIAVAIGFAVVLLIADWVFRRRP